MEDKELQNSENWDFAHAKPIPGGRTSRVVVSVAFSRNQFEIVAAYAESMDKRTSEFIREAALEKAGEKGGSATLFYSGSTMPIIVLADELPSITNVCGSEQLRTEEYAATTN